MELLRFEECCKGLPNLTQLKLFKRFEALKKLGLEFDSNYHIFSTFELGFYWDYDIRRLKSPSLSFWALHNASFEVTDPRKYFEVVVTELTPKTRSALQNITTFGKLSYDFEEINRIVNENLLNHELEIDSDQNLADAIVSHTGGTLKLDTPLGLILSQSRSPKLKSDMIVWRSLDKPFAIDGKIAEIGDKGKVTRAVWSTSYDPISSYGFAMADETENHPNVYMLKILIPKGFNQGWFVENTFNGEDNTLKEQFEYSIFGGSFEMINYYEQPVEVPDSAGNISYVFTRFFELIMH